MEEIESIMKKLNKLMTQLVEFSVKTYIITELIKRIIN